ncbi:MAG: ATP-dependent helicase [Cyclobacteriaceae bacterium]
MNNSSKILDGLNERQQEAVLTTKNRVLVLAGAGAGKTSAIIKKIIYLVFEKNIKPSKILAVTFTKDAANEMIDRLILEADNKPGDYSKILEDKSLSLKRRGELRWQYQNKYPWISNLTIKTFHSFSYGVLSTYGSIDLDNKFKIITDKSGDKETLSKRVADESSGDVFRKALASLVDDRTFLLKLKRYIIEYYVDQINIERARRKQYELEKPYTTLNNTKVRSKSERDIADWLYSHDFSFVYEPDVNFKDFQFNPDFFIPTLDIYIEHTSAIGYPIKDKEEQFNKGGKMYYVLHEDMNHDIRAFHKALERITSGKVDVEEKKPPLKYEDEFRMYHDKVRDFLDDVKRLNEKIKVENLNFKEVFSKSQNDESTRISRFYQLAKVIIDKYASYCHEYAYLDFNDLIIKSLEILKKKPSVLSAIQNTYDFILVDEFQDVNTLQIEFLNSVIQEDTQLFCVGDDWQSIYGFRGSEVKYIVNFEQYFDSPLVIKFDLNYRSNDTIVKASNRVIRFNKHLIDKEIKAFRDNEKKKIFLYSAQIEEEDGVQFMINKIKELYSEGYTKEDILILYRRTKHIYDYRQKFHELNIPHRAKTIHGSKGLEAKIVFIVGLRDGEFPNVWQSDRIFQIVKEENVDLLEEEERRLFYVALTRAKESVFLLSEQGNESTFIDEIGEEHLDRYNYFTIDD